LNALGQSIWLDYPPMTSGNSGDLPVSVDIDEVTQHGRPGCREFIKPFELLLSALRSRKRA
jgi:hypothetical protein